MAIHKLMEGVKETTHYPVFLAHYENREQNTALAAEAK